MKLLAICFLLFIISSCTEPEQRTRQNNTYFDLKNYFEKEADRLNKAGLEVAKSASINGSIEEKVIKIKDFNKELSSFITADINKASWKGDFEIKKDQNTTTYTTANEKIPVKKLEIQYQNGKVVSVYIIIKVNNILYHSTDTLTYSPNHFYEINKTQKIKLLKEKRYVIRGQFKNS